MSSVRNSRNRAEPGPGFAKQHSLCVIYTHFTFIQFILQHLNGAAYCLSYSQGKETELAFQNFDFKSLIKIIEYIPHIHSLIGEISFRCHSFLIEKMLYMYMWKVCNYWKITHAFKNDHCHLYLYLFLHVYMWVVFMHMCMCVHMYIMGTCVCVEASSWCWASSSITVRLTDASSSHELRAHGINKPR